jgi:hypothetical protein
MVQRVIVQNVLIGGLAVVFGSTHIVPHARETGSIVAPAISLVSGVVASGDTARATVAPTGAKVATALGAFETVVRPLSHPNALTDAFRSYFAYKSTHPDRVRKPYLYFVDYGLPSTTPRGYVFDMTSLRIVDGPFMVAHGRGSSVNKYGIPSRFSNAYGSNATSLGLYLAQETYGFRGKVGGRSYGSIGLKLQGVSTGYNDNARARKVVAHGAPYVTSRKAGRSEGCPAMEQARARRLLPALANGAMVFLFAPNQKWLETDRWVNAATE